MAERIRPRKVGRPRTNGTMRDYGLRVANLARYGGIERLRLLSEEARNILLAPATRRKVDAYLRDTETNQPEG